MNEKLSTKKRTVTALIGNEILLGAVKKVLQKMGYQVRTDMESCGKADFAIIGAYFLLLGVVNQVRAKNPSLPMVLIDTPHTALNGNGDFFYDVIDLDGSSEMDSMETIEKWFTEGRGKFLIGKKGD